MEKLYSAQDAADRLGLRVAIVKRYCQAGKIEAQKVGNAWVIGEAGLRKFERKRSGQLKAPPDLPAH